MNPPARTYQTVFDLPEDKTQHKPFLDKLIAEGYFLKENNGITVIGEKSEKVTNEGGSGRGRTILLD